MECARLNFEVERLRIHRPMPSRRSALSAPEGPDETMLRLRGCEERLTT